MVMRSRSTLELALRSGFLTIHLARTKPISATSSRTHVSPASPTSPSVCSDQPTVRRDRGSPPPFSQIQHPPSLLLRAVPDTRRGPCCHAARGQEAALSGLQLLTRRQDLRSREKETR